MGKSTSRGRQARPAIPARPRDFSPPGNPDEAMKRATEEISAKLDQIASSRVADRPAMPAARSGLAADSPGISPQKAQVTDCKLISKAGGQGVAEVISINARPHAEKPGCIEIRIDGWEGHLLLSLPSDRAALLVRKIEQSLDVLKGSTARGAESRRGRNWSSTRRDRRCLAPSAAPSVPRVSIAPRRVTRRPTGCSRICHRSP